MFPLAKGKGIKGVRWSLIEVQKKSIRAPDSKKVYGNCQKVYTDCQYVITDFKAKKEVIAIRRMNSR